MFENPSTFWGVPNLNLLGQVGTGEGHAFNLVFSPTPLRPLNIDSDVPFHDRWATEVLLAYDAHDGSLELDTTGPSGGAMTVYEIEANSNFFAADAFHPIFGTVFEADGRHLTETGFGGIPEGVYNLGPVLPPDLSWDQLDTMLNVAFHRPSRTQWLDRRERRGCRHEHQRRAGVPPLYYDRATGNLTMDVTEVPGGVISGYSLRSNSDEMFLPQNYTPFLNTVFTSARGGDVGESNFAGVPAGVYSVGDVLPANFTEEELRSV